MNDRLPLLLSRVRRRLRAQRALELSLRVGLVSLGVALAGVVWNRQVVARPWPFELFAALATLPVLAAIGAALQALPRSRVARRIDSAEGTHDLLTSALAFAALAPEARTPFMQACIGQAERLAPTLDARRSAALHLPRPWPWVVPLAAALFVALRLPANEGPPPAPEARRPQPAALATAEDLAAYERELRQLGSDEDADALVRDSARELNALIEQLQDRELDRVDALERLRALEARLRDGVAADGDRLREALAEVGRALGRAPITDSLAQALTEGDARAAEQAMARLEQRMREGSLSRSDAASLRRALDRAQHAPDDPNRARAEEARRELERLLKKSDDPSQAQAAPPSLLERKRRELDRLERQAQGAEQRRRELDRLRRELGQAAQSTSGPGARSQPEAQHSADAMQRAAQELQRMAEQQKSQQRAGQLGRAAAQLREQLARGPGPAPQGDDRRGQARGAGTGKDGSDGAQAQGRRLDLQRFSRDARGNAQDGAQRAGLDAQDPTPGDGDGKNPARLLVPAQEQGEAETAQALAEPSDQAGSGGLPGKGPTGTRLDAQHTDSQLAGLQGRGPTRSEVIREASARGFASREYEQVHADYQKHAESVIERDDIPGGYRYYVRRYFQLIRPREDPPHD